MGRTHRGISLKGKDYEQIQARKRRKRRARERARDEQPSGLQEVEEVEDVPTAIADDEGDRDDLEDLPVTVSHDINPSMLIVNNNLQEYIHDNLLNALSEV